MTLGPFVDELKRPVTEAVMKSSSQTLIALLHYHIKSKQVQFCWVCVLTEHRYNAMPNKHPCVSHQEYDEKQQRGYPDQVASRGQTYWEYVERESTEDCTLEEIPDEWEQERGDDKQEREGAGDRGGASSSTPEGTVGVLEHNTRLGDDGQEHEHGAHV